MIITLSSICLYGSFFDSVIQTVSGTSSNASKATTENQSLIKSVQEQTGLSTTQTVGALGTLLGYAQNNTPKSDYNTVTDNVSGLKSLTNSATIAPLLGSLTSSDMVQTTLKSFGIDPSLVQTIVPILVNYVTKEGGTESGNILSNAFSGLLQ